jgi:hypothetical protein
MPTPGGDSVPDAINYKFDRNTYRPSVAPYYNGIASVYPQNPYAQQNMGYADGGTVEQMSRDNALGGNQMFPQAGLGSLTGANRFQNATNTPTGSEVVMPTDYQGQQGFAKGGSTSPTASTAGTHQNTALNVPTVKRYMQAAATPSGMKQVSILAQQGDYNAQFALNNLQGSPVQGINSASQMPEQKAAQGGIMGYAAGGHLGSYSDGGRLLKGPGTGISDDIPATIGNKQPARLADGEFVVPARIVSEIGQGSTEAGARELYKMMDRVQSARKKTVGKGKFARNSNANKNLPA